ncbi:MAG: DUF3575 domain-containing protein [Candidatus Cryptobacteroides sp.]
MSKFKKVISISVVLLLAMSLSARAQKVSIATNFVDWAFFGTINVNGELALNQHFSVEAGAKYNPWTFRKSSTTPIKNQQISASVGAKYWLWYVNTGWWMSAKLRFTDYTQTGLIWQSLDEGKSLGAGLALGYSYMLGKHFNIDLGLGLWGGRTFDYVSYHCVQCMSVEESGSKFFIRPDNIEVSLKYVF